MKDQIIAHCSICGVSVNERRQYRTNPIGEKGIFSCAPCIRANPDLHQYLPDNELRDFARILYEPHRTTGSGFVTGRIEGIDPYTPFDL